MPSFIFSEISAQESLGLSQEEKEWLATHQKITVVQDPGWPPIEFADEEGRSAGITHDYLTLIESKLGIKFERISGLSWQEAYSRLKKHEIDMTTSVTVTPERLEFWEFTKPYMKIPIVIVTHSDVTYISSLKELEGKDVAVVDGYAMGEWIAKDFPQINLVKVNSAEEGLIS
jgi:two-component system sensor histidine kinase EvgS